MKRTTILEFVRRLLIVGLAIAIVYYAFRNTTTASDAVWVILGYYAIFALLWGGYCFERLRRAPIFELRILCTILILYALSPRLIYYKDSEHIIVFLPGYINEFLKWRKQGNHWHHVFAAVGVGVIITLLPFQTASKVEDALDTFLEQHYPEMTSVIVQQNFPTKGAKLSYAYVNIWYETPTGEQIVDRWLVFEDDVLKERGDAVSK